MDASIFLAKLLGPLFLILGIALPLKAKTFHDMIREFIGSPVLIYLAGFLGLLSGLALILTHNLWVADWRLIITLIGWLSILRALITIFKPRWIIAAGRYFLESPRLYFGAALPNLLIGLALSFFGYFAG